MEKLHDLKQHICSFENLMTAYRKAAEDKRYRSEVISFGFNLAENLLSIQRELLDESYRAGKYREFYVRYPKPRLVMALSFRDRVVQWAIYLQINPYIDKRFIAQSYGCRNGKGTLAAAQCLLHWMRLISRKPDAKDWVIIKGDISKYFYRVDHETALRIYAQITDDAWFLRLIGRIINDPHVPFGLPEGMDIGDCPRENRLYSVGMPIGNLTSQETANVYLDRLDRYCKHVLRIRYYARYMDDFIIVTRRKEAQGLFDQISKYLKDELRLTISPKSRILPAGQPCEFVGYSVSPHGLRMRKKTSRHIKRSLLYISDRYAQGGLSQDKAMQTIRCYIGMTRHCNGHTLRRWISEHIVLCKGGSEGGDGDGEHGADRAPLRDA